MPPVPTNNFRDKSKKFIGGAEVARRKARLPKNSKANKLKKAKNVKKFKSHNFKHPMEIFYSSLLKCNVEDLLKSNKNSDVRKQILHDILDRAGMPPIAKLPSSYENYVEYYSLKASLVLEEARCQISQELSVLRQRNQTQNVFSNNDQLHLTLVKVKPKKQSGNIVLLLEKTHHNINQYTANHHNSFTYFTPKEQYNMKPGCLHEMCFLPPQQRFGPGYVATAITYVQPLHNFGNQVGHPTGNARVQLVMCNTSEISESLLHEGSRWYFYPLTTMISCQRQFEGCVRFAQVPFMSKLCAWKEGTHIRFDDEGNEEFSINTESSAIEKKKRPTNEINKAVDNTIFQLNESQETAASKFLRSPTSSLTLVQGPPGTGKTTFLVSVIYRCLLQKNGKSFNMNKRVMVTAPTNRAVTVLANRFLDLVEKECEPNLILIGVEDKLLDDADANVLVDSKEDPFTVASLSPSLRSIYVYTWLGNIIKMYHDLGNELSLLLDSNNALSRVTDVASMLNKRLSRGIPILYKKSGAFVPCQELEEFLSEVAESFTENIDETKIKWQQTQILAKSKHIINKAISFLRTIQSTEAIHELLSTANVIFCTLSTAGTSFLKSTNKIDDLFVDEAAAASEAELCIPFHLLPQRMLAVGDPKQLPVTLLSQEATQNGLGKSLHERLMYDCGKEHLMLQIQYRMRPEISMFPSAQFYGGKISDGGNVLR